MWRMAAASSLGVNLDAVQLSCTAFGPTAQAPQRLFSKFKVHMNVLQVAMQEEGDNGCDDWKYCLGEKI